MEQGQIGLAKEEWPVRDSETGRLHDPGSNVRAR